MVATPRCLAPVVVREYALSPLSNYDVYERTAIGPLCLTLCAALWDFERRLRKTLVILVLYRT